MSSRTRLSLVVTTYSVGIDNDNRAALEAIQNADGAGQIWDFSVLAFPNTVTTTTHRTILPGGIPGENDPHFTNADYSASVDSLQVFGFFSLEDSGDYLSYGSFAATDVDTTITYFDPPRKTNQYPIEFENSFDTTVTQITLSPSDSMAYVFQLIETVTGWGTLVTSAGTVDALRV